MAGATVCASSAITALNGFLTAAASAHLIFHVYSPLMMMEAFMMATHLEALTSTGATLCCSSFCVSCCLLMRMEVAVLKRFLD